MIPIVGYHEHARDFPMTSVPMRVADSLEVCLKLQRRFGATQVKYLGRGFNNAHHRIVGRSGQPDLVVRRCLFTVPAMARRLDREYRVLEHLQLQGYPHAPCPVRRLDPAEVDNSPGFVMTFVAGDNSNFDDTTLIMMGEAVGRLHRLPLPEWMREEGTVNAARVLHKMVESFEEKLQVVAGAMSESDRKRLTKLIASRRQWIDETQWCEADAALLHGDLGDHNFLRHNGRVVLTDWEFAAISDPTLDLMWCFARDGFSPEKAERFLSGYAVGYGKPAPAEWLDRLRWLTTFCVVEDALWAQSGLDDLNHGENLEYFSPTDRPFFERMITRIHEVQI